MTYQNYPEFRMLLKNAISAAAITQADFARETHIAPETLNRMLNKDVMPRPNKLTLRKIASLSCKKGITLNMLLAACGYAEEKIDSTGNKTEQFKLICKSLCMHNMTIVRTLDDLIEPILNTQSDLEISYDIKDPMPVMPADKPYGDYCSLLTVSCVLGSNLSAEADFLIFFYMTDQGSNMKRYIISSITDELDDCIRYGSETAQKLKQLSIEKGKTIPNILIYEISKPQKYKAQPECTNLFNALTNPDIELLTISGIGFYINKNLPDFKIKKFLRKHHDTFCISDAEKLIYDRLMSNKADKDTLFKTYKTNSKTGAGSGTWLAMIVNIILRENEINVQGWKNAMYVKNGERQINDLIMFPEGMPWDFNDTERTMTSEMLTNILDRYAIDLMSHINYCRCSVSVCR